MSAQGFYCYTCKRGGGCHKFFVRKDNYSNCQELAKMWGMPVYSSEKVCSDKCGQQLIPLEKVCWKCGQNGTCYEIMSRGLTCPDLSYDTKEECQNGCTTPQDLILPVQPLNPPLKPLVVPSKYIWYILATIIVLTFLALIVGLIIAYY